MYIWSHGFEVASTVRYDHGAATSNDDFYTISTSGESHSQTASVAGAYGTGWFAQGGNALFVSSPQDWYITKDASRMVPWNLNGPTGEWGLRMTQPGMTVGPKDPVAPYRLNIQPEGFGDLKNVAVSFDCRFEAGAILARGKTDVGICRLTTKFSLDDNEYPDASNKTPLIVDVNSAGQVELWMYNSSTSVIEFKVASERSLPTGKWFRMTVHAEWPPEYSGLNRFQATVYVDGEVWLGPYYVHALSWVNPVKDIQGFRLGYVIDRPDPAVTPDANFQDFDNVVMFVHPTQEELTKNYYCIPVWPADNSDAHDVIQKTGPAFTDTWYIYDGSFTGPATTTFSGAINPQRNPGFQFDPEIAAVFRNGGGADELVLRPEIPSVRWGNNYDPNQLSVIGVNAIQSFGMSTASYTGDPSAAKFQKTGAGNVYFGYPGWRSGGQSRYQSVWPLTSVGSFQFTGQSASMWWSPSPYKQVSGSNWDGLNPNFANMTNFTNWSWVDDFEKGAIPFMVRAGNNGSSITPWMTFAGLLEVCASWSVPSAAYDKKPDAQLIIKDKLFDADRVTAPFPSQVSPYMGLPYAATGNMGTLLPFMEGFWDTSGGANSAGRDLYFQLSETGSLGYDATFSWRFSSETNDSLRGYMDQNMHWGHHNPYANLNTVTGVFAGWTSYNTSLAMAKQSAHCVGYSTTDDRLLVFWYNGVEHAYVIAHKKMSTDRRGVATPESEAPYTYVKFDGNYTAGRFPANKQIGEDCPYCAVVELSDGTMRFFHCYRDTNLPITDGWLLITKSDFTSGYYNVDMYASIDGGLTWTLEKERILDAPLGGSRIIRHMVAAADGDWMRVDFQFYDTMLSGDFYWMPGRLSIASGDRGASWASIETPQGTRPDGYDVSMGNADSGIYLSTGPSLPLWSQPKVTYRTDETADICGSGRGDGSFYRFRSTYNQNGASGSYVNRYGYLTGWGLGVGKPSAAMWEGGITVNVFERGDRADSWGFIDTPVATSGRGMDGIRSLSYGDVARYAVATPAAAYFGQVTIESKGSVGLFIDGARWDGRFSWCVPTSDPYNYSKESGALVSAYKYQTAGSYYPAAKNIYDPTLEQYLGGLNTRDEYFDPSGLARRGGLSWGLIERSIDAVWAGDRVAVSSTLCAKDFNDAYGIPLGLPVPDPDVMPVCLSFMGGWEKRPIRRLDGWSDYWKPQLWSRDWTSARGWPGVQTLPAVTAGTYLYPGRAAFTPAGGYPWTQFGSIGSGSVITSASRTHPYVQWIHTSPGTSDNWGWFASDTFSSLAVGTTTQGDTQLMAHGGIVDCCVYTQYGQWPYNLGNGPQRTEYNTVHSRYSGPQRGFTIETARNNSLTGGSTVFMGIQCNVIAAGFTNIGDPVNPLYKGQVNIYESAWDAGTSSMYAARTLFSGDFSAPTPTMRSNPYPINIRLALVDGYTLSPATTYTFVQAMYRANMSNDDWTVSGLLTIVGMADATATLTEQRFLWGMMEGGFTLGSYYNTWSHMRWGVGRESHMGAGFPDHARAALGSLCAAFPINITQNVAARWGGTAGFDGDSFTAPIKYSYGTDQIGFNSPQMHWRSTTAGATESIIYYAPQTETTDLETYYRHNAIGLFNTNKRKMEVTYATDTTFASVTTTFTVDATRYADAIVTGVDKDIFSVEHTSSRKWKQNELVGMYVELKKGSDTYIKKVTANWGNQIQLQGLPSALTNFVDIWTTTSFYGSDVVHFMRGVPDGVAAKAMRIQFAPGTTATAGVPPGDYWKLGAVVPGMTFAFEVPLDWEDKQDEQPNVILSTTDSGIRTAYKQGQPRRSFSGSVEGDIDRFRDSLRLTLRNLSDYNKRPMVLSLDSQNPNLQSMYCRWSGDVSFKNEGWRFNPDTLKWERVGSMGVDFEEEI